MALVVILLGIMPLGDLLGRPAYAQTAGTSVDYAENNTAAIAAFVAYDQDGGIIRWSLSGPDDDLFTIDGGKLAFKKPPNYEDPQSAAAGNVYRVTVQASGGAHDVVVTVTDVDEAGTASIDRPQPQVSRPLEASLSDEDERVRNERWQWARSQDQTTWTDIRGATSPRRTPATEDEGMYLRATVTYSDKFAAGKTASAVSVNPVEARTLSNAAPSFADQDRVKSTPYVDVTRSVAESTAVGRPIGRRVSATDADDDILFYELLDTPDLKDGDGDARFTIDSLTGQIRVGKLLGADDGETEDEDSTALTGTPALPDNENADTANNSKYVLRLKVSDPSTASATVNVIVKITNVNEPPDFADDVPTLLRVRENGEPVIMVGDSANRVTAGTYAVTDQDTGDTARAYSVSGDDKEFLEFDNGILKFKVDHKPNFEEKNSYSISVVVRSGSSSRRRSTTLDVTIDVVDTEDDGEVSLSQRQAQVGREVVAIPSDPDGGMRISRWTWERSETTVDGAGTPLAECIEDSETTIPVVSTWTAIDGASLATYTPKPADVDTCLRATVFYTDNLGDDEKATGVLEAPTQDSRTANAAPKFVDQDLNSAGDQSDRTSRKVEENTEAGESIGAAITAYDDDDDLLIYTLNGADAVFFSMSRDTGQLKTKASLNFEARNSYSVVVTATDPSGATDDIQVTINIIDVHDPVRITGVGSVRYPENGTEPLASYTAFDEGEHVIRWSVSGRDDDLFTIEDGVLAFKKPPNYEDPQSGANGALLSAKNVYRVTVEAAGGTRSVSVTVTDVDEAGTVIMDRPQPQVGRPLSARLSDEDDGVADERWRWARSEDGRTWTNIEGATAPQRRPAEADEGMYLRATVIYSDKFGAGKTASAVTANRVEPTTLFNAAPSFADQDDDESTAYVDVARSVPEHTAVGMSIGDPVSATDADSDILLYELLDTPDLEDDDGDARFTIDGLTGQIRVGKVLGADAGEREDEDSTALTGSPALPSNETADDPGNSEYVLRVRASDPSTASATVNVIVTVAEVNEAPAFGDDPPTLLSVVENADPPVIRVGHGGPEIDANTYAVTDKDSEDTVIAYSVSGADGDDLVFNSLGVLSFKPGHEPDFEDRSSYSITVVAHSGNGPRRLASTLDVTIEVVDGEDLGVVVLSQRQPEVGVLIYAMASDDDGGVIIKKWEWELSEPVRVNNRGPLDECRDDPDTPIDPVRTWTKIAGASAAVYAPKAADVDRCLRAKVVYIDNVGRANDKATGVLEVPVGRHGSFGNAPASDGGFVNAAPVFTDQDSDDESDSTSREVPENTEAGSNIGAPVEAQDEDDDLLIYTIGGPDAQFFRIGRNDGQIKTEAPLNYEVKNSYSVVVTATDPFGATDSIRVTINVTDVDDPPVITVISS